MSSHIWQMDVIHFAEFGKLKYIHVCIDTCLGFLYAPLHIGEASRKVIDHCLQAFNAMGLPKVNKTDNGPAYSGNNFISFCKGFGIEHKTGIPYSPMGQVIVEYGHHTLKKLAFKTKKEGVIPYPKVNKNTSCFCLICFKFFASQC
jgi:transposase InsO family protein